jgi:uncharacterized Zn-binding protein involved in type VI secretion
MGCNQRPDTADIEIDAVVFTAVAITGFTTLKQTTINQQAVVLVNVKLVARTGDTLACTVVVNFHRWQILSP